MKKLISLLVLGIVTFSVIGCAAGESADDHKANADVGKGPLPEKLQKPDSAGGGGSAPAPDTPNTSPD